MKRVLAILLVLTITVVSFAGCGAGAGQGSSSEHENSVNDSSQTSETKVDKVKVEQLGVTYEIPENWVEKKNEYTTNYHMEEGCLLAVGIYEGEKIESESESFLQGIKDGFGEYETLAEGTKTVDGKAKSYYEYAATFNGVKMSNQLLFFYVDEGSFSFMLGCPIEKRDEYKALFDEFIATIRLPEEKTLLDDYPEVKEQAQRILSFLESSSSTVIKLSVTEITQNQERMAVNFMTEKGTTGFISFDKSTYELVAVLVTNQEDQSKEYIAFMVNSLYLKDFGLSQKTIDKMLDIYSTEEYSIEEEGVKFSWVDIPEKMFMVQRAETGK